jgi:hypothetical protein
MAAVLLLGVAGGAIRASNIYCVETEFSAAPADDAAFQDWLEQQPGVVKHTVHVERTSTTPPKLVLTFVMVQNLWRKPSFPHVETKAIELGYRIGPRGFRDQGRPK